MRCSPPKNTNNDNDQAKQFLDEEVVEAYVGPREENLDLSVHRYVRVLVGPRKEKLVRIGLATSSLSNNHDSNEKDIIRQSILRRQTDTNTELARMSDEWRRRAVPLWLDLTYRSFDNNASGGKQSSLYGERETICHVSVERQR